MSETSFHFETPPDFQPNVDYRSVIEKGEIVSTKHLEGYWPMSVVAFKTGESAIFKTTDDKLEAVVSAIDSAGQFDLIPPVAARNVEGSSGMVQHIPEDSQLAIYYSDWKELVSEEELIKAAAFDFALDSKARTQIDILINRNKKKIFLINNDGLMLLEYGHKEKSVLAPLTVEKGPVGLSEKVIAGFRKVIDSEGELMKGLNKREADFVSGFVSRAKLLVENKALL
ncbi:MAG TPA: hypothetical protein VJ046_01230 [Candidatus Paceibacterota bacterium]|nr:hypothetical protein [Candidatus Paceibacterota bacterium]